LNNPAAKPHHNQEIRNIAIIAHVDHGKTTLVDALLKQSNVFRDNQPLGDLIMDSHPLERERGITILAKNTAVTYRDVKINIIDTPGHADFGGEVERVINMADACLLVVDAVEGPMPQTRYVLKKALKKNLRPLVVINKIDRQSARVSEVVGMVQDLFLEVATEAEQLDYPVIYTSGRDGYATFNPEERGVDMDPLFKAIIDEVPPFTGQANGPLQLQVAALDYDNHIGQIAIGRIHQGRINQGQPIIQIDNNNQQTPNRIDHLFVFQNLERTEVSSAGVGDIVAISGVHNAAIGDTIADPSSPEPLPPITLDEPTLTITIGVNTSPFAGREGNSITARQLHARLKRELQTNVSLKIETTTNASEFTVIGRGELHLGVLLETLRREGYEIEASRPQAVIKTIDNKIMEPYERLFIDTDKKYIGPLTENLAKRAARLESMLSDQHGSVHLEFAISTRGLIGFHSYFIRTIHGDGVMNTEFIGYEPFTGDFPSIRTGALVASEDGIAVTNGLSNAQGRGNTFIDPGTAVYEGMIIGSHQRDKDIVINVCKEKKKTNVRSSTSDIAVRLAPPTLLTLEESLDFIASDELVEITPLNVRMRKRLLGATARKRGIRDETKSSGSYK
jgi:GTP-binding protein